MLLRKQEYQSIKKREKRQLNIPPEHSNWHRSETLQAICYSLKFKTRGSETSAETASTCWFSPNAEMAQERKWRLWASSFPNLVTSSTKFLTTSTDQRFQLKQKVSDREESRKQWESTTSGRAKLEFGKAWEIEMEASCEEGESTQRKAMTMATQRTRQKIGKTC